MAKHITINVINVTKIMKKQAVLSNINMTFEAGKIYGIVGHNGSGKTMLFKSICGFIKPTSGEITVWDQSIGKKSVFPEHVGVLLETPGFLPHKSGLENLAYLAFINNKINKAQIKDSLAKVGLQPDDNKKVKNYSLGMRQRLGIAQAIMEQPKIIILDEPMNALDQDGIQLITNMLLNKKKEGCTILLATHHESDIHSLCDYVYRLENGVIREEFAL
ncbi:ATP-binding cassette domain-containing protein [Paenibacillus popilliae]|uniref:ATPase component n=1 Tax=Paenibacillus popilliae ATCC 14706 TaxID=1212764 RepID=M9LGQ1_PAEPP|nr:ATP-binding cassette domain-containing protein [Paenibacillus popilliae]GAC41780.1 ATPase component [Paenibacillus popilliae ATCC 14706]